MTSKKYIMTSLPLKDSKNIWFHYQNSNANNITLSKNQFYKHNQLNKASIFGNFCSDLILLLWFFLHVILINFTIYFRVVAKVLIRRYQGVIISEI